MSSNVSPWTRARVSTCALVALSASFVLVATACNDDETVAPASQDAGADAPLAVDAATDTSVGDASAPMTIHFAARVGAEPFRCTSVYANVGTSNATVRPLDFRMYVSDVRLVTSAGTEVPFTLVQDGKWQYQNVALLDFEDKTGSCANGTTDTNSEIRGTAPAGTYTGVRFTLGVPFALNHGDVSVAPSPLNVSGLFWSWNSGYKFLRVDTKVTAPDGGVLMPSSDGGMGTGMGDGGMMMGDAGDGGMMMDMDTTAFNIHLGSTECQGDAVDGGGITACGRPSRGAVELAGTDPFTKTIVADYAALVAGSNLSIEQGGAPGCMSGATDPECTPLFTRLGIDPANGQPKASTQTFFHVE